VIAAAQPNAIPEVCLLAAQTLTEQDRRIQDIRMERELTGGEMDLASDVIDDQLAIYSNAKCNSEAGRKLSSCVADGTANGFATKEANAALHARCFALFKASY
jgi:hypothetical protein